MMARALRIFGRPSARSTSESDVERDLVREEAAKTFAVFDDFLSDVLDGRPPAVLGSEFAHELTTQPDFQWSIVERWRIDNIDRYEAVVQNIDTIRTFANEVYPENYRRVIQDAQILMSDLAQELHPYG
ncbi:hypothetical protein [Microbacterium sp. MTN4-26]|uniref:hypothetical protein n=2 Tax=unclassified Microbacterium TaxID=2609290 RepID=UPI0036F19A28